jgi:hypothetical protein
MSGLMIPARTSWEMYFLRIAEARVLVVLLAEAFFRSIPCLNEVYAAIKKCVDIIPIRVDDSGDSDILRDETRPECGPLVSLAITMISNSSVLQFSRN